MMAALDLDWPSLGQDIRKTDKCKKMTGSALNQY